MKIRSDFVSNSSSSSFIVAINKGYEVKDFAKDLAKACVNKKSEFHYAGTETHNKRVLDFCLNTYELLYLGQLKLGTKQSVYTLKKMKSIYKGTDYQGTDLAQREWDRMIEDYKRSKEKNADKWLAEAHKNDIYDEKAGTYTCVYDVLAGQIVTDKDTMTYHFNRFGYKDKDGKEMDEEKDQVKLRVEKLIEFSKAHSDDVYDREHRSEVFQVTMNTIKNTRNLLDAKKPLVLEDWCKDIDAIQKRLEDGEKIFGIRIAHSGDGIGCFYIYSDDDAEGLDNMAVEYLHSECM